MKTLVAACAVGFVWTGCQQTGPSAGQNGATGNAGGAAASPLVVAARTPEEQRQDERIARAVDEALNEVGVGGRVVPEVKHNVVVLIGAVDDLITRKRVVEAAESVRGVTAVVPDILVRPVERTTEEIENDVRAALDADPAMRGVQALVAVRDGTVALGGTAPNWQSKRLATWVAENVRGVRGVENVMRVTLAARSDEDVKRMVEERLAGGRSAPEDISVAVKDGRVVLAGTVASLAEKNGLISDAYVEGVRSVDGNELRVDGASNGQRTAAETLSDEEIRRTIEKSFVYDPRVLSFRPRVAVENGVVTLSGEVSNLAAKRAAAMLADHVTGVREVQNNLSIRTERPLSDTDVASALKEAFLRSPRVDLYQLEAQVENGRAVLRGAVNSAREKWNAEEIAMRTHGVVEIDNQIEITGDPEPVIVQHTYFHPWSYTDLWWAIPPPETKPDAEIRKEIEDELFWNPFTGAQRLTVEVKDGVATLTGSARSNFEKRAAENCAYEAGARKVENRIEVAGRASPAA